MPPVKKPAARAEQIGRRCAAAGCTAFACFGQQHGDAFSWACGEHRDLIKLPPLVIGDYNAPQGRLL